MPKEPYTPLSSIWAVRSVIEAELQKLKAVKGDFAASLRSDLNDVLNVLQIAGARQEDSSNGQ